VAASASITPVGDWAQKVDRPLREALRASVEVCGRTGEEACRHALILMAQSARKLAKTARKNRTVERDDYGKYVEVYNKGRSGPRKVYEWMFSKNRLERIPGTWENAKRIGNRGLAKRSWMWGLGRLGAGSVGAAIRGTSRVYSILTEKVSGYVKENRLDYIQQAMPSGWEAMVEASASNKIKAQAKLIEQRWRAAVERRQKSNARGLGEFFGRVA